MKYSARRLVIHAVAVITRFEYKKFMFAIEMKTINITKQYYIIRKQND